MSTTRQTTARPWLARSLVAMALTISGVSMIWSVGAQAQGKPADAAQTRAASESDAGPALDADDTPFAGAPFFLLSDATYGSDQQALVRLEVTAPQSLEATGGVDIVVYRVPDPVAFLKTQRNLHRIDVRGVARAEGLANTLTHVWDNWAVRARQSWQSLFSADARRAVTAEAPSLKTSPDLRTPSRFEHPRAFKPLPGFDLVQQFRYPVQAAQPIAPPSDLHLAGSSSHFIEPVEGNVQVPLGQLAPGLYLVEAMSGRHRANTLLFVSDTMVLTKVSEGQMLVWSAHRAKGAAVAGAEVVWTDGVGVLQSGRTDAQGLLDLKRDAPEATYVWGVDPSGGVFISENFYVASEIYNTKLYAVTDRPLYRPGDTVRLKVAGREFRSARESVPVADGQIEVQVNDPAGQQVASLSMPFSGRSGADGQFLLPENAPGGGYEILFSLRNERYTAAFRVAEYQKPHFEIHWLPGKPAFDTGEPVKGKLQLSYPDGQPVVDARIVLSARAQPLTMIDGELDFGAAMPMQLPQSELKTDKRGEAAFELPPTSEPSRYTLTALATDGAAYRVRTTRELLVERAAASLRMHAQQRFSRPGEDVRFDVSPGRTPAGAPDTAAPDAAARGNGSAPTGEAGGKQVAAAQRWDWLRLEDRTRESGAYDGSGSLVLRFDRPGTYTVSLRDAARRVVGAAAHFVSGDGQKAPVGSIQVVFDRDSYAAGQTASALVTFPDPVDEALLTLERDQVEATALLSRGSPRLRSERLNATQWRVQLDVIEAMSPNISLSVATVRDGEMIFQNQGLRVQQPRIALTIAPLRDVYAPGEKVDVELSTSIDGKPVAAELTVGVVDEMIYVLQPEIAPTIDDFFFHPRRNNVRTSASFDFIGYDLATSALGQLPRAPQVNQRAVKLLERPRRDDVDTAAWLPALRTDASGKLRFSFTMPDSLTRWRLTARAMAADGLVGQQTAWVRSDKPFYLKWASPHWQRRGDRAQASVALFNQSQADAQVQWSLRGAGLDERRELVLKPGANFVSVPLAAENLEPAELELSVSHEGKVVDRLDARIERQPPAWRTQRERLLDLSSGERALDLPADATRVRLTPAGSSATAALARVLDDLALDQGGLYCSIDDTSSRVIAMAMALTSDAGLNPVRDAMRPMLMQRMAGARLALAQRAGPNAMFSWWWRGMEPDPFLTVYAYYADWHASRALRNPLPADYLQRLLDVYAESGFKQPPLQRALMLHWMRQMGLPTRPMHNALIGELLRAPAAGRESPPRASPTREDSPSRADSPARARADSADGSSAIFTPASPGSEQHDAALLLAINDTRGADDPRLAGAMRAASDRLAHVPSVLIQSLRAATEPEPEVRKAVARSLLQRLGPQEASFDRVQALLWLGAVLGGSAAPPPPTVGPGAPWVEARTATGYPAWELPAASVPPQILTSGDGVTNFYLSYETAQLAWDRPLRAQLERNLYRVVQQGPPRQTDPPQATNDGRLRVKLQRVAPGSALDVNALYLDVIEVRTEQLLRWAMIDAALPPGASVEQGTWGIDIEGADPDAISTLERATNVQTPQGYAVPIDELAAGDSMVVRHLLRFAQRGQYVLPAARLVQAYDSGAQAREPAVSAWTAMEVR